MRWTVPNILTALRLVAAPGVLLVFLVLPRPEADWAALTLFVGASATDWVDGRLARAWEQRTLMGTMLDPIADKAIVTIALATLTGLHGVTVWIALPAALILLRETFVSGLREFLGDTAGTLAVTKLAKWKTATQMVAIASLLASGVAAGNLLFGAGIALLWFAAVLTIVTGLDYFNKARPYLRD
ncbi:CDP-diacylglycerol--glycerol-3-phosphate 3-phosphatidyltransferase [Tropicimonas sp. IMCC6043]|uniref:CDP-diacylglycerol--glycerol-3-phosphate 3-phosphatidyltransferase n=1 Tax=Tropicimonas sp. IMCC6043 TaxID=2510645 RepID=UPI00101CB424|nr:CDP-diacylglycerol--glycerol-3-phosphate 3-phosphatidyltransferase [Tropicimonas sp. IMCC6043]RYH07294.1 CDP-diacylglycerol--glycerol-3-phosphate 3-phosphatidyltransferase [Tropicimonas sp. IMCC6043]